MHALHMLKSTARLFTVSTALPRMEEFNTYGVLRLFTWTQKSKAFREIHHRSTAAKAKPCARRSIGKCHLFVLLPDDREIHLIGFGICRR